MISDISLLIWKGDGTKTHQYCPSPYLPWIIMNEKKKKLMFSRCSDSCMATVSKSIRRKPCLELMIPMWLQIQVYVDQGWRLERAAYVEVDHWVRSTYGWGCRTNEECKVQMKEVKFRDAKVIAHVHHIAVDHWRQMQKRPVRGWLFLMLLRKAWNCMLKNWLSRNCKVMQLLWVPQVDRVEKWKVSNFTFMILGQGHWTAQRRPYIVTY